MNRKIMITSMLGASCLGAGALTLNAFAATPTSSNSPAAIVQVQQQEDPTDSVPSTETVKETGGERSPGARLTEVLAPLIADGTLTQAQADAVITALQEARGDRGGHHDGFGPKRGGVAQEAAATALGLSTEELGLRLRDGATIAEIATEQGVDVQVVIDALVAEATTYLAEEVAEGELTQAEADERLSTLEERITDRVNNGRPEGGERGGRRGGRGGERPADAQAPAGSNEATVTTEG